MAEITKKVEYHYCREELDREFGHMKLGPGTEARCSCGSSWRVTDLLTTVVLGTRWIRTNPS
jgi:hypothetical protein